MFKNKSFVIVVSILILLTVSIGALQTVELTNAKTASEPSIETVAVADSTASPYSCRYGLSAIQSDQTPWLDYFNAGWTLDFGIYPPGTSDLDAFNSTFTPMVRIKQEKTQNGTYLNSYYTEPSIEIIRQVAQNYPGKLWFLGNEPDRVTVQDDIYPQMYAVGFHDVAEAIKEEDPTALIAIAGLIQPTAGRLQYLDIMWDTYDELYGESMPVDVWNIHGYILSEIGEDGNIIAGRARVALGTDPNLAIIASNVNPQRCNLQSNPNLHTDNMYCNAEHDSQPILKQHVINMRTWMKEHGQQNKPLVINEYGSLFQYFEDGPGLCFEMDENGVCFPAQRVSTHMQASSEMFESFTDENLGYPADGHRMIQQWLWFTIHTENTGQSSNLLVDNYTDFSVGNENALTQNGVMFKNLATKDPLVPNLKPIDVNPIVGYLEPVSTTVNLSASVLNSGNLDFDSPVTVSFYSDSGLTQLIGEATVNSLVRGCGLPNLEIDISVPWELTTPGVHNYWVKVDSGNSVAEENEGDNVVQSFVLIDPVDTYLPTISR